MATADATSLYRTQYLETLAHLKAERFEQCIELAKYNLTDPTLPPYYRMRKPNTDRIWYSTSRLVDESDEGAARALAEIRSDLDELQAGQEEHAPEEIDEELVLMRYAEDQGMGDDDGVDVDER
ncbi:hypothetical protein LTR36_003082 [Oleoguttula mirabilis]|uniref:Uncharacterized protein n=1 Tax=Oleoguttula mirabilis TaxID=1507867 RepID=A0AAV9JWI9_9PEZI|nr:hypothetical protein LTR36_003082 [Oleoguttula mirabilis]